MSGVAVDAVWKGEGKPGPARFVFGEEGLRAVLAAELKKDPEAAGALFRWESVRAIRKTTRFMDGSIYVDAGSRPIELFFDSSEETDRVFALLQAQFGAKVPFVDVPETPLKQLMVPVGWGLFFLALGVGLFFYFRHLEEAGGSIRIQWMIALLYKLLGPWGVLAVLGGLGIGSIGMGVARYRKARASTSA